MTQDLSLLMHFIQMSVGDKTVFLDHLTSKKTGQEKGMLFIYKQIVSSGEIVLQVNKWFAPIGEECI